MLRRGNPGDIQIVYCISICERCLKLKVEKKHMYKSILKIGNFILILKVGFRRNIYIFREARELNLFHVFNMSFCLFVPCIQYGLNKISLTRYRVVETIA